MVFGLPTHRGEQRAMIRFIEHGVRRAPFVCADRERSVTGVPLRDWRRRDCARGASSGGGQMPAVSHVNRRVCVSHVNREPDRGASFGDWSVRVRSLRRVGSYLDPAVCTPFVCVSLSLALTFSILPVICMSPYICVLLYLSASTCVSLHL